MQPNDTTSPDQEPSTRAIPIDQAHDAAAQQQNPSTQKPSKNRTLTVVAIVFASVIVLTMSGFAGFYFLYRTPDAAYDDMLRELHVMRQSASIIPSTERKDLSESYDDTGDAERKEAAKKYISTLDSVKQSRVLSTDHEVRRAYDSDKTRIEAYGQSSLDMFTAAEIYMKVDKTCRDNLNIVDGTGTVQEYNERVYDCENLLRKHPHVPLKTFDDAHYTRMVDAYSRVIATYRSAYIAFEAGDEAKLTAMNDEIMQAVSMYKLLTNTPQSLTNTHNPTDQINHVIATLEKRKTVFFRH